jgi:hypothetical protein
MRDLLEEQIIKDALNGDTTVLAELLSKLSDEVVYASLDDLNQVKVKFYYEIHITGKNGFSTSIITDVEMDDDEIILKAYADDILSGNDCHYVDYINKLDYEEWNEHFNFNK